MIYENKKHKAAVLSVGKRLTRVLHKPHLWKFRELRYIDRNTKETLRIHDWKVVSPEELCKWKS